MGTTIQQQRPASRRLFKREMSTTIAVRWEEVWKLLPKAMKGDDPEAVHAARVASRRLRAAMDGAAGVFPKPWYRSLHKSAKTITRTLGNVRDQDVLLGKLAADRENADAAERPGIDYLAERIVADRADARSEMRDTLGKSQLRRVRKKTRSRFPVRGSQGARRDGKRRAQAAGLPNKAQKQIEERVVDLLGYEPIIPDAGAVEQLHDARIAVKRLRYTLELFEHALGDDATLLIQDTKGLQEVLGQLHDLDVNIQLVEGELDRQRDAGAVADPGLATSLETIVRRDQRTRQDIHHAVVDCWEELMDEGFRERLGCVSEKR